MESSEITVASSTIVATEAPVVNTSSKTPAIARVLRRVFRSRSTSPKKFSRRRMTVDSRSCLTTPVADTPQEASKHRFWGSVFSSTLSPPNCAPGTRRQRALSSGEVLWESFISDNSVSAVSTNDAKHYLAPCENAAFQIPQIFASECPSRDVSSVETLGDSPIESASLQGKDTAKLKGFPGIIRSLSLRRNNKLDIRSEKALEATNCDRTAWSDVASLSDSSSDLMSLQKSSEDGWAEEDLTVDSPLHRTGSLNHDKSLLRESAILTESEKQKSRGDPLGRVVEYFQRGGSRLAEQQRRLKTQIWSSVVTIVLVEAKGLLPMDPDGFSDPYVKFRLGNEKYKSKVELRTLSPRWLEQFDFHLFEDQSHLLDISVWDKDFRSKDDFMGRSSIDLSEYARETTHHVWVDLQEGGGRLFLLLTISGTTSMETISDLLYYKEDHKELASTEKRYAIFRSFSSIKDVGHLIVKVFRAHGLVAADIGGKSDPFCVLELVNSRLQTQTDYKTLSPNWNKIFTFSVKDIHSVLEVTVYDEDRDHKVEFLGKVAIPIIRIKNGEKKWSCWEWDSPVRSAIAFVLFLVITYNFEVYMAPALFLFVFFRNYVVFSFVGSAAHRDEDSEFPEEGEDLDDDDKDKEEKKTLKEKLQAIQEVTATVQNAIGQIASLMESFRKYLVMAWGISKFTRKLLRPHSIVNNEVLNFLSRVPNVEELRDFRELRPSLQSITELRRESRKKKNS